MVAIWSDLEWLGCSVLECHLKSEPFMIWTAFDHSQLEHVWYLIPPLYSLNFQSEEDSKWLQREETNLKKRLSLTASFGSENSDSASDNNVVYTQNQSPSAVQVKVSAVQVKVSANWILYYTVGVRNPKMFGIWMVKTCPIKLGRTTRQGIAIRK